jgi:prolyl oligopeptidase
MSHTCNWLLIFVSLSITYVQAVQPEKPPVAPVRPVTDNYFGTPVTDPYRWMEAGGPELLAYMRQQNEYTLQTLKPFAKQNEALFQRLIALSSAIPVVAPPTRRLDRFFFTETPPDKSDAVLMVRAVSEGQSRLLLDPATFGEPGKHAAISYYVPSWDGKYVAVGISLGGSENATLHVVETETAKLMPESIPRAQEANPSWSNDNKSFYYSQLQKLPAGASASAKYKNMRVFLHVLGAPAEADTPIFGPDISKELHLPEAGQVEVTVLSGSDVILAGQSSGVVETEAIWMRKRPSDPWRQIIRHNDQAQYIASRRSKLFIATKSVPNGKVVSFDAATQTYADASLVIPETDRVLSAGRGSGLVAARDALYVYGLRNGAAEIVRVPYDHPDRQTSLQFPEAGSVSGVDADTSRSGITFRFESWTRSPLIYDFEPGVNKWTDTELLPRNPADFSDIVSEEVEAESTGGVRIPLSILRRKQAKLDGSNPTLMNAYGAYGFAISPAFSTGLLPWLERGGIIAIAHVRGGGERGEAWHQAGMKTTKQHTVDDYVACARYLIDHGYTSPSRLAAEGTSAGGIAVGGFLTQHPELLRAVLYRVGITDILRSEMRATGAQNAYEYGFTKIEPEFRAMYALSPYAHVRDGAYPAVFLETGANDPRVTSWMLTKMTARLQAANSSGNPILLRVDFDAGHGIGSNRTQALKLAADEYTFLGWQLAMNGFAPNR